MFGRNWSFVALNEAIERDAMRSIASVDEMRIDCNFAIVTYFYRAVAPRSRLLATPSACEVLQEQVHRVSGPESR